MTEATMSVSGGEPVLRFERRFAHPPAKVWRAVSDPAELANWFPAAVEAELRPGAPMRFTFPDEAVVDGVWDGEVLEVDAPKVFMFRWNLDVLRFELIPDGDGCRLVFTQSVGGGWVGKLGAGRTAAGWDFCLDALAAGLDGEPAPERNDWLTPMAHYVDKFGLGEGNVESTSDGWLLRLACDLVWQPAADVWALLTEDTTPAVGDEPPLTATNGYVTPGRLTAVEAPHVLEYQWCHENIPAGTVRFTIVEDAGRGHRVEVTQTVPTHLADVRATALAAWQVHLELFFAATQGATRCPWPTTRTETLTAHYTTRLA